MALSFSNKRKTYMHIDYFISCFTKFRPIKMKACTILCHNLLVLHFATFCNHSFLTLILSDFLCQYLPLNASVTFMPLFAAVCLSHILPIFATLRQYKICSTFCCSLTVLYFANIFHLKAMLQFSLILCCFLTQLVTISVPLAKNST